MITGTTSVVIDNATVDRLRAALNRISRRINRQVSGPGLTATQLSVLATVQHLGPVGLKELAEVEGINPTMLSRIVGKLEEVGLIQRQVDAADRRAARVEATATGTRLHQRLLAERSALLAERLAELPPETAAAIIAALPAIEELVQALEPRRGVLR